MNVLIKTPLAVTALIAVGPGPATAAASSTSGCGPLTSSRTPPSAQLPATLTLRSTTGRVQIVLRNETQRSQLTIRLYMVSGGRRLDVTTGSYSCTAARSKDFIAFPITPYAHRLFHHHARLAVHIRIKMTNGSGVSQSLQRRAVIVKGVRCRTASAIGGTRSSATALSPVSPPAKRLPPTHGDVGDLDQRAIRALGSKVISATEREGLHTLDAIRRFIPRSKGPLGSASCRSR